MHADIMTQTANALVEDAKGILAADMSPGSIDKQFGKIGVENNEETRRAYREMLFTTPGLEQFISGVIQHEEALSQASADGTPFTAILKEKGIITGVKVDKGYPDLEGCPGENLSAGLDDLAERMEKFFNMGARFAKWRAIYNITDTLPSDTCIEKNAEALAKYAIICQENGIVPIVEPEVLMNGTHTIERAFEVTDKVLAKTFEWLEKEGVAYEHMLLKPNMVLSGYEATEQAGDAEIAEKTLTAMSNNVPVAVPGIMFLSGGQTDEQAAGRLSAINSLAGARKLSYSYGRALQTACQAAWKGNDVAAGQAALLHRARCNSAAADGKYSPAMEQQAQAA